VKQDEAEKFQNFLATYKDKILPYYNIVSRMLIPSLRNMLNLSTAMSRRQKTGDASKLAAAKAKEEKDFQQQANSRRPAN